MRIGLIGAMAVEVEALLEKLEDREDTRIGMDTFSAGRLFGCEAVLAVCGPGKVNAALCAQSMILRYHPDYMINLGVAGAGCDAVGIGDMVIATCAVQHDMDTSPIGDPVGFISKVGMIELPCDPELRALLVAAAAAVPGLRVFEGVVATGDQFICDEETRRRIRDRFNAVAVEMEGGAVAHACVTLGVPCGIVRSISDNANGHSTMDYPVFTRLAAGHSVQVIETLLSAMAAN